MQLYQKAKTTPLRFTMETDTNILRTTEFITTVFVEQLTGYLVSEN